MKIRLIERFLKIAFRNSYCFSPSIMDFTYFGLIDSKTSIDSTEVLNDVIVLIVYLHYGLRGAINNPGFQ